mgnify:FL=1
MNIETCLGFPSRLVLLLVLKRDQVLIDQRERLREVVLRVRIEVTCIILNQLSQLLFLSLPDVASLTAVLEDFDSFWHVDPCLGRPA